MRFRGIQILLSTGAAILLCSYILYETNAPIAGGPGTTENPKDQVLMQVLMQSLKNSHFEPKNIDDEYSSDVFDLYLKRLDFGKRFLLEEDIDELLKYRLQIDDQINISDYSFFDLSYNLINKRIKEARSYYESSLKKPFDFTIDEEIELDEEKRLHAASKKELKDYWRKSLKRQALARVLEMEEEQEKASEENDTVTIRTFKEMEVRAREKLLKSHNRWFDRMDKLDRDDRKRVYLNSLMNVFGPHTGYFPPKEKENFDIGMSGQLEGIGAQLQEKDGYIKVTRIVPGSPSYLQGELEEGDLILKVGQAEKEPVNVVDMRLDDAVQLIRGKKGTEVRLTVKKVNGQNTTISIIRDVVVLEETYAKSAIVTNEDGVKVGYIRLPKFYADFTNSGGRNASKDIKAELLKLKEENVEGIVIDLRSNGGGSLRDAIEMTGHFIDRGPVVQVKSRYGKPEVMKDTKSEIVYDGPLVVMTNQFSASASEIVAAAIQDYDRGIILGTKSSFGKGTVQRFLPLDRALTPAYRQYQPLGAVKVTTQKFYRINGGATQLRGVTPDIVFPDQYSYVDMGEAENEFVMPWDEIPAAAYTAWQPPYNEAAVVASSEARIASNGTMQKINQNAERLKDQRDETKVSLNMEKFRARMNELDKEAEQFKDILQPIETMDVTNIAVDYERISQDSVKQDINEKWLKNLKKDVVLNEAVYILGEMESKETKITNN